MGRIVRLGVVAAVVAVGAAGVGCGKASQPVTSGEVPNSCPVDMERWGVLRGAEPERGDDWYRQADNGVTDPGFWMPQQVVVAGQAWWFSLATEVDADEGAARVRVGVDWYSTPGGDNSGYLGQDTGPWVDVPVGAGSPTRVGHTFTVPHDAVRANVIADLEADSPHTTWTGRDCDYRLGGEPPDTPTTTSSTVAPTTTGPATTTTPTTTPATTPPTTAPPTTTPPPPGGGDTAAGRHGWGAPLPQWSDEFDYGSAAAPAVPDQAKWTLAGGGVGACWPGHASNGRRCDANTRVVGGLLRMVGEADGDSGWLASQFGQRYGRWEARVRSEATGPDNGRQYHPLLILWPDSNRWPEDGEYDYLENGEPGADCVEAFVHYPHAGSAPVQQEFAQRCGVDLTQWHNVAVEWTPDHVKGFVDGEEWFTFSGGANDVRQCIQCAPAMHQTIQLDNFFGGDMQPAVYEIDWLRTYPPP